MSYGQFAVCLWSGFHLLDRCMSQLARPAQSSSRAISSIGTDSYEASGADAPAYEVSFDTLRHIDLSPVAD
jgi:hypothetical protein